MTEPTEDLDAEIRRLDPDRWAASRFVGDAEAQADLVAIYAFNSELARAAEASNALLGEIRLTWWREALDEIYGGGRVRTHPVAAALARAVRARTLPRHRLEAMVDGRLATLEGPPVDEADLLKTADGTAGAVMLAAASVLASVPEDRPILQAGRAWGVAGLARNAAAGLRPFPAGVDGVEIVTRARDRFNAEARRVPAAAFPAVAYASLAADYVALRPVSDAARRLKLVWATLRGRI
jgi:phytoene synthase